MSHHLESSGALCGVNPLRPEAMCRTCRGLHVYGMRIIATHGEPSALKGEHLRWTRLDVQERSQADCTLTTAISVKQANTWPSTAISGHSGTARSQRAVGIHP
jgi:hypothetical protein